MLNNAARGLIGFSIVVATTTAAPAEPGNRSLEGTWTAKAMEISGKSAPAAAVKLMRLRFVGDSLFFRGNFPDGREVECSFVLDETQQPHHLDFTPAGEKKPVLAVYERTGKTLKICVHHGSSNKGRPTALKSIPDSGMILLVLSLQEESEDTQ